MLKFFKFLEFKVHFLGAWWVNAIYINALEHVCLTVPYMSVT